jgi:tetratricopeptide (TPR) repeat protein
MNNYRRKCAAVFLWAGLILFPVLKAYAGEKEELDEILRLDSAQVQAIENNKTADVQTAVSNLIEKYRSFLRKYPGNVDARNYLGGLYYDFGMPDEAFQEWRAGLKLNPQDPYLHNNIAEYYSHNSGEPEKAIKETREAIRLKTNVAVFHFNLADYYDVFRFVVRPEFKSMEDVFEECLKEYRKAIELDPANSEYASVYARTLTYGPKFWKIKDSYPASEKIKAWERCLLLAADRQQKEFIEKEIKKLK